VRRLIAIAALCSASLGVAYAADKDSEDTPAAAKTRKLLKEKVTVEFKDTRLEDAIDELKDQVKGLKVILDTKGGVSRNRTLTYKGKDVPLEEALDGMFKKVGLGYIVISKKNNAYDGAVEIRASKERGYPEKADAK
jgi:type II secretory pathway component GspD/PulD (secretin)